MANETDITLDIKINTAESATTVKELKNSLKELKNELNNVEAGSDGFKKLSKSINETEGKLGDLNDSFNTLTGSGVERANSSLGLLKEGFSTFDFDKIKTGLSGLGAAFKAVPIFLMVEGITYLVTHFEELSQGSGLLAKALRVVGDVIDGAVKLLYKFTDLIGVTNSALDEMGETIVTNAEKTKEALADTTKEYDRQIAAAKASGESTVEMEIAKQKAIQATNDAIIRQAIALINAGGEMTKEQEKIVKAAIESNKDAANQIEIIEATSNAKKLEAHKSYLKDKEAADKAYNDEFARRLDLTVQSQIENEARDKQAIEDKKNAELNAMLEINAADNEEDLKLREEKRLRNEKDASDAQSKAEGERKIINETLVVAKMSFDTQAQLSNFLFDLKRKNLVKGSAEDLRLAKRQFQINKALAIQSSIISGIQGVINALSAQSVVPEPFGTILKVATAVGVGIAATVNTAKIASQQFNEGGGSGGGGADVGSSLGSAGAAPAVATPTNTVTKINDDGSVADKQKLAPPPVIIENKIVETDVTSKQKNVATIEESAKFG